MPPIYDRLPSNNLISPPQQKAKSSKQQAQCLNASHNNST